jgi:GNAT superfamily N-acetyltransferase
LAIEYNCSNNDFSKSENIITESKNNIEKRHYIEGTFFFQMATFGENAVITANKCLHEWLQNYVKDKEGHWIFEHKNLMKIEEKLKQYNKKLWQTHHMFLSFMEIVPKEKEIKIKWFEAEEIHQFYGAKLYPNALRNKYDPKRPDVLAIAAYDNDNIMGMAGCSADTPLLWQVGIDVNKNYRGKGIGTYLITLLKNEIEKRGKIPFYGTSLSNLSSWGIALNSGFYPTWIEIATIEEKI